MHGKSNPRAGATFGRPVVQQRKLMKQHSTQLHEAARKPGSDAVRRLIHSQPGLIHALDEKGRTPLQLAARNGCLESVALLVAAGADVNTTDEKLQTPLQMAAYYGFLEVATLLLAKGASVSAANRWQIGPLHLAANFGHTEMVELLLQNGADVNLPGAPRRPESDLSSGKFRGTAGWSGCSWPTALM